MRKFTFLFALFLMMVGTAMAQTYITPGTEKVLTSENLRALTTETPIILCPVQKDQYGKWYDGSSSTTYGTSGTTVTESNIFVWVPILNDGSATGTGYLKKRTAENEDVAYLQTANTTTFGAQSSAQVFYPVTPVVGGTENTAFGHDNIVSGYDETNLVRLVCGSSEGANWFNFNGRTYNAGIGIWTAMEVRNASDMQTTVSPITDLANLSNNKAYTLKTSRSELVAKSDGSRIATTNDISGTFDANNTQYQFALLKNTSGEYFLYSISASMFVNKTGDLVNSPTDPILFKDGNATGTFVLYFDADHYINMGGSKQLLINDYNTPDEGNSFTITPVADIADMVDNVTVNFIVDGKTYSSATKNFLINTAINAEKFATDLNGTYLAYASTNVETVTAETTTINVTCSVETLPFVVSESLDNATWYLIDMHSNDSGDISTGAKNYIWTATTDASAYTTAEVTLPKYDTKQSATFGDNMLWCFKGNVVDGFVIYNKAAGSEYALAKPETGETAVKLAAVGEATPFRIYKSTEITGAACFKKQGDDYYVNTQAVSDVKVLRGWTAADGGSSCRFFAPDHYLLNYAADIAAGPANSLGTAQYFNTAGKFESFNDVIDAANADHFNATATANLATVLTEYASDEANATLNATTITDGGYYRLMNYQYKNYMTSGTDGSTNTLWGGMPTDEALGTARTVVKFVADESNYKLYVQDLEVGQMTDASARLNLTGGGVFTITNTGNKYTFMDVSLCESEPTYPNYRAIHQASDNAIVGWEVGAGATKWYVIPAETIELALTNVGSSYYATAYLPFAVQGSGLYTGEISADKTSLTMMAQENAVPAKTGLVIKSDNPTVTLTICDSADPVSANSLIGSLTPVTENLSNYLVLGKGNTSNSIGFFAPSASLTSIAANKAYLNASDVASGEGSAIALNFGGTSTAILDVVNGTLESNAPVFDLSGRRVMKTVKGSLYIQNGKKFIAR